MFRPAQTLFDAINDGSSNLPTERAYGSQINPTSDVVPETRETEENASRLAGQ
jgi:hypothetical protein